MEAAQAQDHLKWNGWHRMHNADGAGSAKSGKQGITKGTTMTVESFPIINAGTIVTQAGTEYYVESSYRDSVDLIRLHDLKDGFKGNVIKHGIKPGRPATEDEEKRVKASIMAKLEFSMAFRPGVVVKAAKASKHIDSKALYVITKVSEKTVSITKLGGDVTGAYINAPREMLKIVDLADILK